ncbi:MAG: hypothetical protein CMD90_01390 [Gammaproteobacteria bacterium]|nr:hypothetical protein [Gammaproteobacteria bacterium]
MNYIEIYFYLSNIRYMKYLFIFFVAFSTAAFALDANTPPPAKADESCAASKKAMPYARAKNLSTVNCFNRQKNEDLTNSSNLNKFAILNPYGAVYLLVKKVVEKEVTKY